MAGEDFTIPPQQRFAALQLLSSSHKALITARALSMAPPFPTRRELVLVSLLLFFLLFLNRGHTPNRHPLLTSNSLRNTSDTLQAEQPTRIQTRLSWKNDPVPQTKLIAHVPGWTVFDRLYILNGVVYIVSDDQAALPDVSFILSKGIPIKPGQEAEQTRLPTDEDIRIISTEEARHLFGTGASIIDGVTLFVNDPYQFITHYYHWSAELWFGFWRTYSTLDPKITAEGNTTLPFARRIMFNHLDAHHWRDYAHMNEWVVRSSFPSVTMEFIDDWRDRAELGKPFVFDRVVVADRSAAMRSYNFQRYQRTASAAFALPGSVNWWMPIRNNVIEFAGLDPSVGEGTTNTPVITYISRQEWGRRMLIPEHHDKLVKELYKIRDQYGYEVHVVAAEKMTRVEQIRLAARTTILMGVHGNGLTSLVWMKPNPRSTVMEFFFPGGFAHDYEYTTRALGMTHYGFWNKEYFTSPALPTPEYVDGFQGNSIPIDGEVVARLCVERLSLTSEVDD